MVLEHWNVYVSGILTFGFYNIYVIDILIKRDKHVKSADNLILYFKSNYTNHRIDRMNY